MSTAHQRAGRTLTVLAAALALAAALVAGGCAIAGAAAPDAAPAPLLPIDGVDGRQLRVTTTTNFITDLARELGGERVLVHGLLGPGVDPHLYKASAGDVGELARADLILYGGLELEGKMADLFAEIAERRPAVAVTRDLPGEQLLLAADHEGAFDPHVWFDIDFWRTAARTVADTYARLDPANETYYLERLERYDRVLAELDAYAFARLDEVTEQARVLVTSHDAFHYFGRRYRFQVEAIQGVSTATEATTADIERIAALLAERGVRAVFVESSVPRQTIRAVQAAAAARGWQVEVGGELFADAAGAEGTPEGSYVGMIRHNVDAIAQGLGG